jgi:proteasome lid subunit RPN8/RPN11
MNQPGAMSPMRPAAWTDEIHEAAKQHTAQCYPAEAVGLVEDGAYVPLENKSETPTQDVCLGDDDLLRAAAAEVFFHSHPDGVGSPSESDMIYQAQLGIPCVVMVWPLYDCFWWGDMLERAPIIGRGFRHGVHDCYSLVRDWYAEKMDVKLVDQPRSWNWWSKENGQDHYRANFEKAGFRQIDPREATEVGDGLLMAFNYSVPMHGAIVIERDLILHHPAGIKPVDPTRISCLVPRTRYMRHVVMALRR